MFVSHMPAIKATSIFILTVKDPHFDLEILSRLFFFFLQGLEPRLPSV